MNRRAGCNPAHLFYAKGAGTQIPAPDERMIKRVKILVDADACPVKAIVVRLARVRRIPVWMFIDTSHLIDDGYSRVFTVDKARDSADFALVARAERGDVVVTQDYGLAAMAMSRGCRVLNQDGLVFGGDNIGALLESRAAAARYRRAGGRTRGPAPRTRRQDRNFEAALTALLAGGTEPAHTAPQDGGNAS